MNEMTKRTCIATTIFCVLGSLVAQGQIAVTDTTEEIILREGLAIDGIGRYGRSPVHQDALEALLLAGMWKEPQEGDTLTDAGGEQRTWRKVTADEQGWFSGRRGRGGYIYVRVDSDAGRTMLLHMRGNSMAYVNGVPRVGSRYQYRDKVESWEPSFDYVRLPVRLNKGRNDLLFQRTWRSRGRVKARLLKPEATVQLNPIDVTLPDLLVGQRARTVGAIVVINSSDVVQKDLSISVSWPNGQKSIAEVPIIQPRSVRKVAFPIDCPDRALKETGKKTVQLAVFRRTAGGSAVLDRCSIDLNVKKPSETHKRTFVSSVDGSVQYYAVNPGISASSHWVAIEDQLEHLKLSSVALRLDPGQRRFVGTTKNVARLSLELDVLPGPAPFNVQLDGQPIKDIAYPSERRQIWLTQRSGRWRVTGVPSKAMKGPHRYGPFKEAFNHRMVFVYGTAGSLDENAWARSKARFDAEQWWYQGNGSIDIIADVDFRPSAYADRGVVLYGNSETNAAWPRLLRNSPVQVGPDAVTIGGHRLEGDDLACLFLRPRTDSDVACVAVVGGTGLKGMQLTNRLQYIFAGCNYPDCVVIGPEMLTDGTKGVRAAGVFGSDWTVESGSFAWSQEAAATEPEKLPAYIGPDPRPFVMPRGYVCQRATGPITIDGKMDELSWEKAAWTEYHLDIEGQMRPVKPRFNTRSKMLWDDECFYVAAWMEEPHVWGTITQRNAVIFNDNDFEVFIDPDGDSHAYFEFEVNALNTVWNLFLDKPYKHGGNAVVREMPGQKSAVFVKGTLNDPTDTDEYWTVEIAFPWKGMAEHAQCACPPKDGDQWRVGFSRVEWGHRIVDGKYVRSPNKEERTDHWHEDNWIWSPQGVVNMHRPETWGYVQYSTEPAGAKVQFVPDPTARARYLLHKVLYAQEQYRLTHKRYAPALEALGLDQLANETLAGPITMRTTETGWQAVARLARRHGNVRTVHIRQDGKVWTQ